jgi:glycosyltransferase involved in cell wall biosynthesis
MSKRLAYIIYSLSNSAGMERALVSRANFLCDEFDITIITEGQGSAKDRYLLDKRIRRIDLDIRKKGTNSEIKHDCFHKLSSCLNREKFDIVSSLGGLELFFLYRIDDGSKKIVEFRFSYDYFRIISREQGNSLMTKIMAELNTLRRIYYARKYDKIVVLTKKDEQKWRRWSKKVCQIYNAVTLASTELSSCSSHCAIAVGRLEFAKGFDLLIKAWYEVHKVYPDWRLNIYGEGKQRKMLENIIREKKLEGIVSLCGISSNILDAYLRSSFFVLSSREEGFGLVLTEAETCGLPIVTFACPNGPAEIVEDGYNGIVVKDKESIEELAKAMKKMIGNESLRKEMGKNSLKVVDRFSISTIRTQWIEMFNQL